MLNNTTTTKLHEMKLSAMATAFRHQSETDGFSELSFEERFGLLVDAEWTSRRNNRLTRLLKKPVSQSLEPVSKTLSTTPTESWIKLSSPGSAPAITSTRTTMSSSSEPPGSVS